MIYRISQICFSRQVQDYFNPIRMYLQSARARYERSVLAATHHFLKGLSIRSIGNDWLLHQCAQLMGDGPGLCSAVCPSA